MGKLPSPPSVIPRLPQLGPAIVWLRDRGVVPAIIADALGTSSNAVSVADWRERRQKLRLPHAVLHLSSSEGIVVKRQRVDWLDNELESIRFTYARSGDLVGALRALDTFRPQLGRPHSVALLRLLAHWHEHRAWFAVHTGFTRSAIGSSWAARMLYQRVYRDSADPLDLKHLADAALIGSHAHLYVSEPAESLALLKVFREASAAGSLPLGSDHYRQLGIAYALEASGRATTDPTAERVLARVPEVMERQQEAQSEEQLTFAKRQQYLLGSTVNLEGCQQVLEVAERAFHDWSLEAVIAANYRAAAGLTMNADSHDYASALELLDATQRRAERFPHQAAVAYLLRITPRLRLDAVLRRWWVRQVWYLNPHRRF